MGTDLVGRQSGREWWRTGLVPALLVLITVVVIAGVFIDRQAETISRERMRAEVLAEVALLRAKLEGNIASNIQLARGLTAVIASDPDIDQARFSEVTKHLFEEHNQLRSITAAPDLVIRLTYPHTGNLSVLGHDYRDLPEQWPSVRRVVETGRFQLAGPVNLVQGGKGLIGRFPVYVGEGAGRKLWGVMAAVIDIARLYADSGLFEASTWLNISLTGADGLGEEGERFFGEEMDLSQAVTSRVSLPFGSWQIAAEPKSGWKETGANQSILRLAIVFAGALILLPSWIAGRMINQRHDYIIRLRERETDLTKQTQRLHLALQTSKVGLWELDMATGEEFWDERTNEIYGTQLEPGERSHGRWLKAVHPDDRERAEREFMDAVRAGRYSSDYRILWPDGSVRHVRSMAVVFRAEGENTRVVGVNWDVTQDVARSEDLRRAKAQTEARNSELEAARVRIEHNALHDSLTGLPNRRYLDEMLRSNAGTGYNGSGTIALIHIDLDRFKQINDTLGHAAGDAMLIHASKVLRETCQEFDFVARIGGDEFVVVSDNACGEDGLGRLASRIVGAMRKPVLYEGHECRFGVSIGIATDTVPNIDVKQLLINADIALYRAKDRGRNRFEFFSAALQAEVVHTKKIADEILVGLEQHQFLAYYQPQFDARTLDVVGVEALARWKHPTLGLCAPDTFMHIAEELSVVSAIDEIILRQALSDLKRWEGMGLVVPRASVNVSQRRLHDEGLVAALRDMEIEPGRIAFELVESIYLDESDGPINWNIDQIKALGIDVEIDDFGTGYASIVSLQNLRPKRLKIDRQLVDPILTEPGQRRLVASIVDIGKSMDIEIVAEGVETLEHAAILRDLGCDILQGYAFARPMPRESLEGFLATQTWRNAG